MYVDALRRADVDERVHLGRPARASRSWRCDLVDRVDELLRLGVEELAEAERRRRRTAGRCVIERQPRGDLVGERHGAGLVVREIERVLQVRLARTAGC